MTRQRTCRLILLRMLLIVLIVGQSGAVGNPTIVDAADPGLVFNQTVLQFSSPVGGSRQVQSVSLDTTDGSIADVTIRDNVQWLTTTSGSGLTPRTFKVSVYPSTLVAGTYNGTITATAPGYEPATLSVILSIPGPRPDQVHLAWVSDPATTLTVVWRTQEMSVASQVEYRLLGEAAWQTGTGAERPSGTAGNLHQVTLESLTPDSTYEFRVLGPDGIWSEVYRARTAPPPGPADFDFIYVADTGLIERNDDLAQGTAQVINEIANLNPLLVLPGGDYAYYNTDTRFGTLDNSIDVWFNQMMPIATGSVMMPTYGNHEALLGEGFDPWAARFPTPNGFDGSRNYSFDVGDVHFVSIFAVYAHDQLPTATIDWIRQDILAAQAAGARWIIPYFHVAPFADGTVHPSNLALRAQLGPLFESLGVKVVIASHDQNYERTFPLTDVPATNTPTSSSTSCYTMADGVTWVKVSPGGKYSNISGYFSPWGTEPPPPWTAYRDNTMHHFLRVQVSASGKLRVEAYGVDGNGSTPIIQDSFEYTTTGCGSNSAPVVNITSPTSGSTVSGTVSVNVQAIDDTDAPGTLAVEMQIDNGNWQTASYNSATQRYESSWDTTTAGDGDHIIRARATDSGLESTTVSLPVTVENVSDPPSDYAIVVSQSATRSDPVPLDGATEAGAAYIFTAPDTSDIVRVRFYLDNSNMIGQPSRTENTAPYDFMGGTVSQAHPLDTTTLSNGSHTITAAIDLIDGSAEVVHGTFTIQNGTPPGGDSPTATIVEPADASTQTGTITIAAQASDSEDAAGSLPVEIQIDGGSWLPAAYNSATQRYEWNWDTTTVSDASHTIAARATDSDGQSTLATPVTVAVDNLNDPPSSYSLVFSTSSSRSSPVALDGATVSDGIYVFTTPDTANITVVRFYLDDPTMAGTPRRTESTAPYDFGGGTVTKSAVFSTTTLANGAHTITAALELTDGTTVVVHATFTVQNG